MRCLGDSFIWATTLSLFLLDSYHSSGESEAKELQEIVTLVRRGEISRHKVAGSVSVLTREDITRSRQPLLHDMLRGVPGLRIARTGGPGQPIKLYLRGAEPRQTAILIDGVSLRSPNDANGYPLGSLSTANIERIEILRGAQSSLYGPDAAGGVINIVTKPGTVEPVGEFALETGSMNSMRATWSTSGSKGPLNYSFVSDHFETEGVSAARSGTELDPYDKDYFQGRLDYALNQGSRLSFFGFRTDSLAHTDNAASLDSLAVCKERNSLLRGQLELGLTQSERESIIGFSSKTFHSTDGFGSNYHGYSKEFDWRLFGEISDRLSVGGGLEHSDDRGKQELVWSPDQDVSLNTWAGYLNGQVEWSDSLFTEIALRHDENNRYGGETTGKFAVSGSWHPNWRAFGSLGTFFVAPNAYYLANAKSLNSLRPETGVAVDLGIERSFGEGLGFASIGWFQRETKKQFDWSTWSPGNPSYVINVNRTKSKGLEGELDLNINSSWSVQLSMTLQKAEDLNGKRALYSRPEKMFSGSIDWSSVDEVLGVNLGFRHVGKRLDGANLNSPAFTVCDLTTIVRARANCEIHLRIENIFDNDYTEMVDWNGNHYGTFGRSAFLGVTWRY